MVLTVLTAQPQAFGVEKYPGLPPELSGSVLAGQRSLHANAVESIKGRRTTTRLTRPSSLSRLSRPESRGSDWKSRYQRPGLVRLEAPDSLSRNGPSHHWVSPLPNSGHHYLKDMYRN